MRERDENVRGNHSKEFNDRIDEIITSAFAIREEPSRQLNQNILRKAEGDIDMKKPFYKAVPVVAALAAGILATGSITSYAAWKYLSTEQMAEEVNDKKLADAFKADDAININQSQTYGDYKITLLGIVSGKGLSDYVSTYNGELQDNKSYAAVAIEKKDGSAVTEEEGDASHFFISPYIKGENPIHCNLCYMGGGTTTFTQDGVVYRIMDCDNIEAFAKRGVYLGVSSGTFYDRDAYNFDKKSGEISRNENYDKVNALFDLPLDESKGDEKAADELLAKWKEDAEAEDVEFGIEKEGADEIEDSSFTIIQNRMIGGRSGDDDVPEFDLRSGDDETSNVDSKSELEKWDVKRIKKEAELVKGSVKKLKPDKDGNVTYDEPHVGMSVMAVDFLFQTEDDRKNGVCNSSIRNDGDLFFTVYELDKNGTIIGSTYRVKPDK